MRHFLVKQWFLLGMLTAIILATLLPGFGKSGGILHLEIVTQFGIALIFFLHGISLCPKVILKELSGWRLHLTVQGATFILYPLLWLVLSHGFRAYMPAALAMGFCYLMVLPSAVSSSVAMTSVGRGNVPAAIFNASLSSFLGVLLTPLLVQLLLGTRGNSIDLLNTIESIGRILLLPMLAGQLLRPLLLQLIEKYRVIINPVDKCVVLLIVFNAFSNSVVEGIWHGFSISTLLLAILSCAGLLGIVVHLLIWLTRRLGFSRADEVAAVFCGTKKSLTQGVPMAKVIFGAIPMLGMILLPIMLYHQLQIFYCATLANRYAAHSTIKDSNSSGMDKNALISG
ncbi:bile acid:sodium symporter family protein [Dongshaea marina]|uniref:bile acid:sodium symporter family protein n=1 Tax=Dongshaea marina TaxID=2047966 RepID=UPI000D3ED9E2|nr:bile acid:sodium symporter family protein [Dongshaea marina]